MSAEEEREPSKAQIQATELKRLATRIREFLDEKRGPQEWSGFAQPLHVSLWRHWTVAQRGFAFLTQRASYAMRDEHERSIDGQVCLCAAFGLACALDAAHLDPSEAASSPFAWEDSQAVGHQAHRDSLLSLIGRVQAHLEGLHELDEETGVLQNRYAASAANASLPSVREVSEQVAKALGKFKALTFAAKPTLRELKFAASPLPEIRQELQVPSLIGLTPSDFERTITELLYRLRSSGLEINALARIAYEGVADPPQDPVRSLNKRLDRFEEQRKAPTRK